MLLLGILFICSACENCDDKTYHRTVGVGYIMIYDTTGDSTTILYPVNGAKIIVTSGLGYGGGLFTPSSPKETFYTDATGKSIAFY